MKIFGSNEFFVLVLISSQNLLEWTHKSLESLTIKGDYADLTLSNNVCSSGGVSNKRSLSEVVTRLILLHNGWSFSWFKNLSGHTFTLYDHVE